MKTPQDYKNDMLRANEAYNQAVATYKKNPTPNNWEEVQKADAKCNITFTNWMASMEGKI